MTTRSVTCSRPNEPAAINRATLVGLALTAVLAVAWLRPLVQRPVLGDEAGFAQNAAWLEYPDAVPWPFMQPPMFVDLLEVCASLFHWRLHQLHWVGVGCFVLLLCLVYGLAASLHPRAGPLAVLLWATHPMALQGALILDVDNTVLAVTLSAWCLVWLHTAWPLRARDELALGVVLALSLWAKCSTPLGLPVIVVLWGWARGQGRLALRSASRISLIAATVLLTALALYRRLHPAWTEQTILRHNMVQLHNAITMAGTDPVRELLTRLPRVLLWFNPFLVGLGGWLWVSRHRPQAASPRAAQARLLWWYVGLLALGYWVLRGPHYGFPKYHFPLLPVLLAVVSAACLERGFPTTRGHWVLVGGAAMASALVVHFLVGDLFRQLAAMRTAMIVDPAHVPWIQGQLVQMCAALVGVALGVWVVLRRLMRGSSRVITLSAAALVLILGMHLDADWRQHTMAYSTTYTYGRPLDDMQRVIAWLRQQEQQAPHQFWLGPGDVLLYAQVRVYPSPAPWDELEQLQHALQDARFRGLIISPTTHTRYTYQHVLVHPAVQQTLQTQFQRFTLGEYTMWIRRTT